MMDEELQTPLSLRHRRRDAALSVAMETLIMSVCVRETHLPTQWLVA